MKTEKYVGLWRNGKDNLKTNICVLVYPFFPTRQTRFFMCESLLPFGISLLVRHDTGSYITTFFKHFNNTEGDEVFKLLFIIFRT